MYPCRPKAEALSNTVDVVKLLRNPTDPSTERTTPPRSAHAQLDDVSRFLDLVEAEGEFRQHDSVVTMMMFYRRRASPKHSIIKVDYGGGGHRTRLKDQTMNCCVYGVPLPPYIKEQGGCCRPREGRARRSPTPTGSRTPPFSLLD